MHTTSLSGLATDPLRGPFVQTSTARNIHSSVAATSRSSARQAQILRSKKRKTNTVSMSTNGISSEFAATSNASIVGSSSSNSSATNLLKATFYPYNYIVKSWTNWLDNNGVPKAYTKQFLAMDTLISGFADAKHDPVWGKPHVFYKCKDTESGVSDLYFIDSDISQSLLETMKANNPTWETSQGLAPHRKKALPYSSFSSVEQITFKTREALIAFRNRQKGGNKLQLLQANKKLYEQFQKLKQGSVMSIDIESFDREHSRILEIGWCFISFGQDRETAELKEIRESHHVVIAENSHCRNTFVPNNRNHFNFGESVQMSLDEAVSEMSNTIANLQDLGPVILVFHNASAERNYFKQLGLDTSKWQDGFPAPVIKALFAPKGDAKNVDSDETLPALQARLPVGGVFVIDTQHLFGATDVEQTHPQASLKNTLSALGIPHRYLHNAGNDACYTLAAYEAMVGSGVMRDDLIEEEKAYSEHRNAVVQNISSQKVRKERKGEKN